MRDVEQQLLRFAPALPLRRSAARLIRVDEEPTQEAWRLWRIRILRLRHHVRYASDAHNCTMDRIRLPVVHKMYRHLMPHGVADAPARPGGEKRRRHLQFGFCQAKRRRQIPLYGDAAGHRERRCSRTLFETSAKSLGSIE